LPTDRHRDRFAHAGTHHVSNSGSSKIMKNFGVYEDGHALAVDRFVNRPAIFVELGFHQSYSLASCRPCTTRILNWIPISVKDVLGNALSLRCFIFAGDPTPLNEFCELIIKRNFVGAIILHVFGARLHRAGFPIDVGPGQMQAVELIRQKANAEEIEIGTSLESWHEQDRTTDIDKRKHLEENRSAIPRVPKEGSIQSFSILRYQTGTFLSVPALARATDPVLLKRIVEIIGEADPFDAHHLMNAATNRYDWFVTTDPRLIHRRVELQQFCSGLSIVLPSELLKELSSN